MGHVVLHKACRRAAAGGHADVVCLATACTASSRAQLRAAWLGVATR